MDSTYPVTCSEYSRKHVPATGHHINERMQQSLDDGGVVQHIADSSELQAQLGELMQYVELREHIENYWRDPEHQHTDSWTEHGGINEVMLATSLAPDGMLELLSPVREQE